MNKNRSFSQARLLVVTFICVSSALISGLITGCGPGFKVSSVDESGFGGGRKIEDPETIVGAPVDRVVLTQIMNARKNLGDVLEFAAELPDGSIVEIPRDYETIQLDYRASDGTLARSSTGFVKPVKLISVPASRAGDFPASKIASLNKTAGGLHLSASIIGSTEETTTGDFAALKAASPGAEFLLNYEASGKPKFSYIKGVKDRFGARLNKVIDASTQSSADRKKWSKVYAELARAGDRTKPLAKSLLMIDVDKAKAASIAYENNGTVPSNGAWTIAVLGTAVRHGFPNVPCAEFMSQVIREAYKRAGYKHTEEFNAANGTTLIWNKTASVLGLSQALYDAGWIPWHTVEYRPMTGAILMHGNGRSPGHTFMAAGDDGRFIMDNGSPQGRDLRKTTDKIIKLMYHNGVFFLPPGIVPKKW
ncbi:MAG: hypothetical protein V4692_05135 [Bdellovibrionota bacterium]